MLRRTAPLPPRRVASRRVVSGGSFSTSRLSCSVKRARCSLQPQFLRAHPRLIAQDIQMHMHPSFSRGMLHSLSLFSYASLATATADSAGIENTGGRSVCSRPCARIILKRTLQRRVHAAQFSHFLIALLSSLLVPFVSLMLGRGLKDVRALLTLGFSAGVRA
ncbi:hypothetical protein B0H10DRAFT_2243916 [Mycena sp. CBHHK59/15]|nr:hypothetical protein B0H10DRAFT_2243916 [Mycena sp. CBHHK59/15]